jgi:hypothetical protein
MTARTPSRSTFIRGGRRAAVLLVAGLATAVTVGACSLGALTGEPATALAGGGRGLAGGGGYATGGGGGGNGGGGGENGGGGGYGGGRAAEEQTTGDSENLQERLGDLPLATLTAGEIDGLQWMREEEKLAHDVYVALAETWGSRVFQNIAGAETTHGEAIKALLDRYGIDDPAAGLDVGTFSNPEIGALYEELVARGRTSLVEAFTVGALIEELDIADLRERATDTPDIALVYEDLERGSENHLRAFARNLERQGVAYQPSHLSISDYESIVR